MKTIQMKRRFIVVLFAIFVLSLSALFIFRPTRASATGVIVMDEQVYIRNINDGRHGIKFTAYVDGDSCFSGGTIQDGKIAGVIVVNGEVEAATLTHASNGTGGAYEDRVLDIRAEVWDSSSDKGSLKAFNAVVWNIPVYGYGVTLTARGYVGTYNESTESYDYEYSANACSRSVAQVASRALASDCEDTYGIFTGYVDGYVESKSGTITADEYDPSSHEFDFGVGQSVNVASTLPELAVKLTTVSNSVRIEDQKITVINYKEASPTAEITASIGSLSKTVTINVENRFEDDELGENLLADFDKDYYIDYGIKKSANNGTQNMKLLYVDAETAATEVPGANGGVAKIRQYANADSVDIPLSETVTVSGLGGIYLKIWVNSVITTNITANIKINGVTVSAQSTSKTQGRALVRDSWNYFYIAGARLRSAYSMTTSFSSINICLQGSAGNVNSYWYIDEIGVLENLSAKNELICLDREEDLQMNYQWGLTVSYLSAGDAECPSGATGGVARLVGSSGQGTIFYFKQMPSKSAVSKIIVRAYVPAGTAVFRLFSVTEAGTYPDDFKIAAHAGVWYDYEINIASWTASTLFGLRVHKNVNSEWYIDSITFVPAS